MNSWPRALLGTQLIWHSLRYALLNSYWHGLRHGLRHSLGHGLRHTIKCIIKRGPFLLGAIIRAYTNRDLHKSINISQFLMLFSIEQAFLCALRAIIMCESEKHEIVTLPSWNWMLSQNWMLSVAISTPTLTACCICISGALVAI